MPTNIDTGLAVQNAVNADHSPHIFTMSNGDLLAIYYDGTNLVWRSKSGGSWSASTTIVLDTSVTPPQVSYLARNGNVIFAIASADPIDATHNGDWFELTYTPATHSLATTAKQIDNADANEKAAGIGYTSGGSANNQVLAFHGVAAGNFTTIQQLNVNPTIVGTDQVPNILDVRSSPRTGLVTDGTTTTYLAYAIATTGTTFQVDRFVTSVTGVTSETPPAPAANLAGVAGVWDGTNYVFIANENNAKLRFLTRTGANTYGSWTDIFSDASLVGEPAVCVKANGDLAVFYRTNKNQANGEIWVVQRTSGTWGSPALFAGGASTGWSNPSVAASDLNDSGIARVVYVTGTASTWTLVEDAYTFTTAGGPPPPITRVQYFHGNTNGTSLTQAFTAAQAGNLLVALVAVGSTASPGTCATPAGWALGVGPITNTSASPPPVNYYLFWRIATGGETSIPVTDTVSSGITVQGWEFNSIYGWPSNPLDQFASSPNQAATTSPVTGTTPTTTQGEEVWIAGVTANLSTQITFSAPTNGFTQEASEWAGASAFFAPNSDALYLIASATGAAGSGGTSSSSRGFAGIVATFRDNAPGTQTPAPLTHGQWPAGPLRATSRVNLTERENVTNGIDTNDLIVEGTTEQFYGVGTQPNGPDSPTRKNNPRGAWPVAPLRSTSRVALTTVAPGYNGTTAGANANDEVAGNVVQFYGDWDSLPNIPSNPILLTLSFAGVGSLTPGVEVNISPAVTFLGVGTLTPGAEVNISPAPTFAGIGTLTPGVEVNINPAPSFAGVGTLTPGAEVNITPAPSFAGVGTLTPGAEVNVTPAPSFAGVGTFISGAEVNINPSPTFAGVGTLAVGAEVNINPAPTFAGVGTLTMTVTVGAGGISVSVAFAGVGTLTPGVEVNIALAPSFLGVGTLTPGPEVSITPAPAFTGVGTLTPGVETVKALAFVFAGSGSLGATVAVTVAVSVAFVGVGSLVPGPKVNITPAPSFVGAGTLTVGVAVTIRGVVLFAGVGSLGVVFAAIIVPHRTPVGSTVLGKANAPGSSAMGSPIGSTTLRGGEL